MLFKEGEDCYITVLDIDADIILVTGVYVDSTSRRRGLGTKLLNKIKEYDKPIMLSVDPTFDGKNPVNMEALIQFYENNGFEMMSDNRTMIWRNDEEISFYP